MHNIKSKPAFPLIALFLFIVSSTLTWGSTSVFSYELFRYIRLSCALLFCMTFFIVILKNPRINITTSYSIMILISLFIFGIGNAVIQNNQIENLGEMIFNWLMIFALTYLIFLYDPKYNFALSLMIIMYALLVLCVTVLTGGLAFTPAPYFVMEYLSQKEGVDYIINYSQGITKIFGFTAIVAFYVFTSSKSLFKKWVFLSFAIFFLCLSAIGGARGDFTLVLAIFVLILLKDKSYWLLVVTSSVIFGLIVLISTLIDVQGLTLFERFTRVDVAASYRLGLLVDALTLLSQSPDCLVFGCGFNYFQSYFDYSIDLHPHNIFVEYVIVFGGGVAIASIAIALFGLYKFRHAGGSLGLLSPLFIFFLLIGLKSGTLVSSWFAMAYIAFFMGVAYSSKQKKISVI